MIDSISSQADEYADSLKASRRRVRPQVNGDVDRLPPHAPEIELGVLGCAFLSPAECVPKLIDWFPTSEVFYDLRNLTVYETILELYDENKIIDINTVGQRLKDKDMLEQVGGWVYLSTLPDATASAANVDYYAEVVKEKWILRNLVRVCTSAVGKVYDSELKPERLVDEVIREVSQAGDGFQKTGIKDIREIVSKSLEQIEASFQRNGELTGIPSGFTDLDQMTSGFQPSDMIIIAARPSMGKSSLAMNIADYVATDLKIPTGVFSLEMTAEALIMRTIGSRSRVNMRYVRQGFLADRDFPRITGAAGRISNAPLFIDDTPNIPFQQFKSRLRRMVEVNGIKIAFLDYLQLMRSVRNRHNRQEEVAELSSGIKSAAKELNIPIVVLTQLNRELDKDGKRKPRLSDLRESGAIEQDADLIGLLYKPKLYDEEEPDYDANSVPMNLLIAKQRNGPTGDINLTFLKDYTRFESASRLVGDDDIAAPRQADLGMVIDETKP